MAVAKMVTESLVYTAKVKVYKEHVAVINPNGRGYDEDNVEKTVSNEVVEITVRAKTLNGLANKVAAIVAMGEDED